MLYVTSPTESYLHVLDLLFLYFGLNYTVQFSCCENCGDFGGEIPSWLLFLISQDDTYVYI